MSHHLMNDNWLEIKASVKNFGNLFSQDIGLHSAQFDAYLFDFLYFEESEVMTGINKSIKSQIKLKTNNKIQTKNK